MDIKNSQNFLYDKSLVKKIVSLANFNKDIKVLEIGPGKGIITNELLDNDYKVTAIELDDKLFNNLNNTISNNNLTLINEDILNYEIEEKHNVFSNIPFNITTNLIQKLLQDKNVLDLYLIMQYEPFLRFSKYDDYLTYKYLLFSPFYGMNIEYKFKNSDFKPEPKARIILASFKQKKNSDISINDMDLYLNFISYLFNKKSKLLFEKIEKLFSEKQREIIKKTLKVEDDYLFTSLTYENIIYLFNTFNKYANDRVKKIVEGFYKEKEDNNPHKNFSNKNNW